LISGEIGSAVLVVGLGNPLMEDDGFGSAVIQALRNQGLPLEMSAEEAPDILHVRSLWRGQPAVWIVDAVAVREAPGTIHRFDHETLLELPEQAGSAHHLAFGVSLRWLLHANPDLRDVRFRLWGAEPASVSPRRGLSRRAQAAVREVAEEIRDSVLGRTVHAAEGLCAGAW